MFSRGLIAVNFQVRSGWRFLCKLWGDADKSLAQPGRKQATVTKLGIYSTYSPQSSIHFLARCSIFCKLLKKNWESWPSNQVYTAAMTSASAEKWRPINCFFSPGNRCSPTGPDPENRVGDQDIGSPGRPVSSGFQVPSELGHCHARTRPPSWPPAARHFSFKMSFNCQRQQRWVILRIDSLALWKIINEEDAVLIPKNRGENFSNGFFTLGIFWGQAGQGEPLWCHSIDCCFVSRFCPWSPIMTGNHLDRAKPKKFQSYSDDWHRWCFSSVFRHFRTHLAENFCKSKSSWVMDPTCPREMPSCSAIDLAKIWRSSKFSSWIWPIISVVVTVLGHPGRGASQVEKSPCLNWATQFLMVVYNGACSPNVSLRMAWISFSSLPCSKKTFITARVLMMLKSRVTWHASFQPL